MVLLKKFAPLELHYCRIDKRSKQRCSVAELLCKLLLFAPAQQLVRALCNFIEHFLEAFCIEANTVS